MSCLNCEVETANPKFCGRSCAASYNNKLNPKRKRTRSYTCDRCDGPCWPDRSYCGDCWVVVQEERSIERWEHQTLADILSTGNANAASRYPYIRSLSRKKYLLSDRPKQCFECSYSLHFDVAHRKPISSFPLTATVAEINDLDNLVPLCKNHHWEFDNGHLVLSF